MTLQTCSREQGPHGAGDICGNGGISLGRWVADWARIIRVLDRDVDEGEGLALRRRGCRYRDCAGALIEFIHWNESDDPGKPAGCRECVEPPEQRAQIVAHGFKAMDDLIRRSALELRAYNRLE